MKIVIPEKHRFSEERTDAGKGFLILLVVYGHAANFTVSEPYFSHVNKMFHVACFLLLPFIYDIRPLNFECLRSRISRYFIPFAFFVVFYGVVNFFTFYDQGGFAGWLSRFPEAIFIANAPQLNDFTELEALWFIPNLISLVCLICLVFGTLKLSYPAIAGAALLGHLSIGALPEDIKFLIPYGLCNSIFLFFIGCCIRIITLRFTHHDLCRWSLMYLVVSVACATAGYFAGFKIKYPTITLMDYSEVLLLVLYDLFLISTFLFIFTNDVFKKIMILKWLGQNSLVIYLLHLPFLGVGILFFTNWVGNIESFYNGFPVIFLIFALSLCGGSILAYCLSKMPTLKNIVFPADLDSWFNALKLSRLKK